MEVGLKSQPPCIYSAYGASHPSLSAGADPGKILRGGPKSKFCKMKAKNVQH